MKKDKTITIKVTVKEYEKTCQDAAQEGMSVSEYVRSRLKKDKSKDWIKKTTVQQCLSHIAVTLDKYEEENMDMADDIRKECNALWEKL